MAMVVAKQQAIPIESSKLMLGTVNCTAEVRVYTTALALFADLVTLTIAVLVWMHRLATGPLTAFFNVMESR
jgi:hypothetical protein